MRIQYRGGVWKNSEDEILKAAVMKYGKNQWPRIASLLVRKSAKQCKARWYEWLDPAIKKTPWTREEEEKLLHLVKVMPTAWRTIAPIIGRTAAQCLEHYEKLVDQARQNADGASSTDPSAPAVSAMLPRPGELDAVPENRPARPDPVDMDEDELEMLSEARARLANTKGKKAKRKEREKRLEAAKRMAQLQKRRELKAAGVPMKPPRQSKKHMDFGTEIPFERKPAPGFYDTTEEDELAAKLMTEKQQIGKLIQKFKLQTEDEKEEEARRRDAAKRKRRESERESQPPTLQEKPVSFAPVVPALKRFSLPPPQLSDNELERLGKDGKAHELRSIAESMLSNSTTTNGEHGDSAVSFPSRVTDVGESWSASRQRQVQSILAINTTETPLHGGENTSVASLGLNGSVTPSLVGLKTPNLLATPALSTAIEPKAIPSGSKPPKRRKRKKPSPQSEIIRKKLEKLPQPKNEYELDLEEVFDEGSIQRPNDADAVIVEDAEEEKKREEMERRTEVERLKGKLLSSAAKRDLPIPHSVGANGVGDETLADIILQDQIVLDILSQENPDLPPSRQLITRLSEVASKRKLSSRYIRRASEMVEKAMQNDTRRADVEREIFSVIDRTEVELSSDAGHGKEDGKGIEDAVAFSDSSAGNSIVFQSERENRLKILTEMYLTWQSKFSESVKGYGRRSAEITGKVSSLSEEARNATSEKSVLKLISLMRQRLSERAPLRTFRL